MYDFKSYKDRTKKYVLICTSSNVILVNKDDDNYDYN